MKPSDLYHTGLVVDDVDIAKANLTKSAGYRWGPTVGGHTPVITPAGEHIVPMRIAYSADEPRLELVQAVPGTLWQPTGAGVHHLGYWSDDVDADVAHLLEHGFTLDATAPNPDGSSMWAYCNGHDDTGPRIELVTRSLEPLLQGLFAAADD